MLAAAGISVGPDQSVLVVEPGDELVALARIMSVLGESPVTFASLDTWRTGTRTVIGVDDLEVRAGGPALELTLPDRDLRGPSRPPRPHP